MRLGSLLRWLIFLAVLGRAGYTVASIGWSYYSTQEIVDKALHDASARHRAEFLVGNQVAVDALARTVRSAIVLEALHEGLRLAEGDVDVVANQAGLSATVRWSHPIVTYGDADLLIVPLSMHRSLLVAPQ